ncbi:MAG: hypothetical protein IPL61_38975 [Myxococcales bacterium]|nr:hypothetical protein [Myxococcales bacterium]
MTHTLSTETFDGVVLVLPVDVPAISAHVRLRRDAQAPWTELEVPVARMPRDVPMRVPATVAPGLYLGGSGARATTRSACSRSASRIEATVMLASGRKVPVTGLPAVVILPPKPPAPSP